MTYRFVGIWIGALALSLASCSDDDGGDSLTGGSSFSSGGSADGGALGSATGGSSGAAGGGNGSTGHPVVLQDGGQCRRTSVQANRAAPDMLIVMDASASMIGINSQGVDRWHPTVTAVNTVVSDLQESFKFGLMTFPAAGLGCDAGQLNVPIALTNARPIANRLASITPLVGMTPTSVTLEAAREVLAQEPPTTSGDVVLPQYVMLVTDGDPNWSLSRTRSQPSRSRTCKLSRRREQP